MQAPIQAPPMQRDFMQEIVGRYWSPAAKETAEDTSKGSRRRKKQVANPCLIQLLTFAVRRRANP